VRLDLNPRRLNGYIKRKMQDTKDHTRIISTVVIPDYSNLVLLEIEKDNMVTSHQIVSEDVPLMKCLVPKHIMHKVYLNKKLLRMEFKIDLELTTSIKGTRIAFMVLDSLSSIKRLKKIVE
jgi:hypothetical protein